MYSMEDYSFPKTSLVELRHRLQTWYQVKKVLASNEETKDDYSVMRVYNEDVTAIETGDWYGVYKNIIREQFENDTMRSVHDRLAKLYGNLHVTLRNDNNDTYTTLLYRSVCDQHGCERKPPSVDNESTRLISRMEKGTSEWMAIDPEHFENSDTFLPMKKDEFDKMYVNRIRYGL